MAGQKERTCKNISLALLAVLVLAVLFSYPFYRDLRRELVVLLSDHASAAIGQQLEIEDISLSLPGGINFYDLKVRNPEGFAPGNLLAVKKITIDLDYRALVEGAVHIRKMSMSSPALTLVKDARGRSNISEGLRRFLSKKGTTRYRIDEVELESGVVDFNNDSHFSNEEIHLTLRNLSSRPDVEAVFEGTTLWAGVNRISFDGRAFPGAVQKRFSFSLSADDLKFTPFSEFLSRYHIDAEKAGAGVHMTAAGDTGKGGTVSFSLQLRDSGLRYYRKKALAIGLTGKLDYHIPSDSADLRSLIMTIGDNQVLSMKGWIREITDGPAYDLTAKIENLDISVFDVIKDIAVEGLVSSESLQLKGKGTRAFPAIEGAVKIRDGSIGSADLSVRNIDGKMKFSADRALSADIHLSASLDNVAGYRLINPADVKVSLLVLTEHRDVIFSGRLDSSPATVDVGRGKPLSLDAVGFSYDGLIRAKELSGKGSFTAKKIGYGGHVIAGLKGSLGMKYGGRILAFHALKIESDKFSLAAESLEMKAIDGKRGFLLGMKGMDSVYPSQKASLKGVTLSGELHTARDLSGRFSFSASGAAFRLAKASKIAGGVKFSKSSFSADVFIATIGGGTITMTAQGRASKGPFPLRVEATVERVDAGEVARLFVKENLPYHVSGSIEKAAFSGTVEASDSVLGRLTADIRALTVVDEENKRDVLKDALLQSEITFQGKDCRFRTEASAGKISMTITGKAKRFMDEARLVRLQAHLAEIPVAEIRSVFWGVFPDALLYAGLRGSVSSDLSLSYNREGIAVEGELRLKGFTLTGENDEYSIGPVNGAVPFSYGGSGALFEMSVFDRADFELLKKRYASAFNGENYRRINIGSLRYGFRLLDDITLWVKQERGALDIGRFGANIFGGRLAGSAVVSFTGGVQFRAGFVLEGLSLTRLCDNIEPIKGYISGMVDGVGVVKGSDQGIQGLIGKADFWTYSTAQEKTKISREFLRKMGGPSLRSYIGDRPFDKGEMGLYLQKGFVIFRDLEISHRNFFGMQDLSVKVAPLSNKISLEDLMWSIVEAASRAGKKAE